MYDARLIFVESYRSTFSDSFPGIPSISPAATRIMVHADSSTNLCSKCSSPLTFQPRVNVDLDLNDSSEYSPLSLQEMMSLCNEDLDDYDAEIMRLQSQIGHVQAQRKRVIDYKTQIYFLCSSFRRFPNEVLCLIFESTCTENVLREYPWPYDTEEPCTYFSLPVVTNLPALVVSAVCTRWRSLALASPTLWSQIRLEISLLERRNDSHTVSKTLDGGFMRTTQLYLDRSANAPLSIILNAMDRGRNDSPALKLLLAHTYRWKTFAYGGECALNRLLGFDLPFPILEKLELDPNEQKQPGGVTCFRNAPNLRSVAGGQISILSLAWNLTSLDTRLHEGEDMNLLRRYPALTTLKLRSSKKTFEPGITSLAKLESFTLMERYGSDGACSLLESIFPTLTFPSLKELIILTEDLRLVWSQMAFSAFISRSTCIITSFSLSRLTISDLNLIAALRLLPSLAKLNIDGLKASNGESSITTHFISSLHGSSIDPLLPKLQSLSMEIYYTTFDDATFVDMISSRWLPSSQAAAIGIDRLRSVVLHFTQRKVDAEIYRPLWQMDEMGTGIVITGCSEKGVGMVGTEEFSEL